MPLRVGLLVSLEHGYFTSVSVDPHVTPSRMRLVASRVPTTPGIPYSRATIAECEKQTAVIGHDGPEQRKQDVEGLRCRLGDKDVPLEDAAELRWSRDTSCGTLVNSAACRQATQDILLVL